ncbi:hypothetical protein BV372_20550 [Nostoc sp. T09]|uniref:hypothetical protein n=1 Tax=Nostoc sp. T09 TaxID=1932621 RepID=UPI000A37E7AB|nr:hypothetical protein [Nostoc sp. T09]OUL31203.1 hypothetical protein BV372_20550 [Nostoc sp. T09]
MVLKDAALLTLINTVACLAFPKLLSIILSPQAKPTEPLPKDSSSQKARVPITTFPYCTAHPLTGSPFCRFRPHFCARCTPN